MTEPRRQQWWNDVVSVDSVRLNANTHLLWGDRVHVVSRSNGRADVVARGSSGTIPTAALGGEPLLELYVIDVGQGDGLLLVTPEGHHVMIDGGDPRGRQESGKNAADFVDWKFHYDYLHSDAERNDTDLNRVVLDVMVASHGDRDHYGGLSDLLAPRGDDGRPELDTVATTVERFVHPGLSPQVGGVNQLGRAQDGRFVELLGTRQSARDGLDPNTPFRLRGQWRDFIQRVVDARRVSGQPTGIERVSHLTGALAGFTGAPGSDSEVRITVLGPVEESVGGNAALRDIGSEGTNKNGHSVALRVDYRDRRILLAGDLNDQSQRLIMEHYGDNFEAEWGVDVTKACHHGSHHVDYRFLRRTAPLATIFSSGDANTFDHPRPWVLAGAALGGRVVERNHRLKAPLLYSTEIARSIALDGISQFREYEDPQTWGREEAQPTNTVSGDVTISRWRVGLDSSGAPTPQPACHALVMTKLIYGLVNVRTDGRRLLFAVRNESNASWAIETLTPADIAAAVRYESV